MPYRPSHNPFGTPFIELESVDSTNNYALNKVHAGLAQHGIAFFAHHQMAGKGQRGKSWLADRKTSLIMSLVADPGFLSTDQLFVMSAFVAVSAAEFFETYAGSAGFIKWPNDLYWHDRKAGGILIENIIGPKGIEIPQTSASKPVISGWKCSVIGIGININQEQFSSTLQKAVSLRQITGKVHDPVTLAIELCSKLEKNLQKVQQKGFAWLYSEYQRRLYKIDEIVKFKKDSILFEARVKGITLGGKLILEHAFIEEFAYGEIEWLFGS